MTRIVTSQRPPRKRAKAAAIEGPVIVTISDKTRKRIAKAARPPRQVAGRSSSSRVRPQKAAQAKDRAMDDDQIRHRFNTMTWIFGATAALAVATLVLVIMLSYQVNHLAEELSELIAAEANESPP
jgi:hypothetical protein